MNVSRNYQERFQGFRFMKWTNIEYPRLPNSKMLRIRNGSIKVRSFVVVVAIDALESIVSETMVVVVPVEMLLV